MTNKNLAKTLLQSLLNHAIDVSLEDVDQKRAVEIIEETLDRHGKDKIEVSQDDYSIIQAAKLHLKMEEKQAVSTVLEIGLINLIINALPEEMKLVKQAEMKRFLAKQEVKKLSKALSTVWNLGD
jgi:hypothetical protein